MISDCFFPVNVMLLPQTILKQKNKAKILKLSLFMPLKACRRSRGIVPLILSLEKTPLFPLNEQLSGPQSLCVYSGEETHFLSMPGIEPQFLSCPAQRQVTVPTACYC
jgi:hypothetical protein